MSDVPADADGSAKRHGIGLRYKIIAYIAAGVATWLATGFGMWPLAYMFPLGLVAVFDRHLANDGGWGVMIGCYLVYIFTDFSISAQRQRCQR